MAHDLLLHFFWPNAIRFYSEFFKSNDQRHVNARWIADHILAHKVDSISLRDIKQAYPKLENEPHKIEAAMKALEQAGWVDAPDKPRRNSIIWKVNPTTHALYAERAQKVAVEREQARKRIAEATKGLRNSFETEN